MGVENGLGSREREGRERSLCINPEADESKPHLAGGKKTTLEYLNSFASRRKPEPLFFFFFHVFATYHMMQTNDRER